MLCHVSVSDLGLLCFRICPHICLFNIFGCKLPCEYTFIEFEELYYNLLFIFVYFKHILTSTIVLNVFIFKYMKLVLS